MNVYLVRDIKTKTYCGLAWAPNRATLWDVVDADRDPYGLEYAKLDSDGIFPDQHFSPAEPNEFGDDVVRILGDIIVPGDIKWVAFDPCDKGVGLLARIERKLNEERAQ